MNRVQKPVEEIDEPCPECGRNLVIRTGRFGRFISCSGFPECRYSRSFVNKTGALCPVCGGDLVERKTKQKKRVFFGCNNYPTCNFAIWERPVPDLCPNCGGLMVIPRAGQDPVCYAEVVAVQKSAEEKPRQDGATSRRTTRKNAESETAASGSVPAISRRSTSRTRKTTAETSSNDKLPRSTTRKARMSTSTTSRTRKTTPRSSTAKKKATARSTGRKTPS